MARWHLSSSEKMHARASRLCSAAGLTEVGAAESDRFFVRSYAKRAYLSTNFRAFESDDWACVAGTMITDGSIGGDALTSFYRAFLAGGLSVARDKAIGHYAIAIKHGNRIHVCADCQGALNLYYARQGEDYIVSNSLHVAIGALDSPTVNRLGLLVHALQSDTIGDETFCRGVKRLYGSQWLDVDLVEGTLSVRDIPQSMLEIAVSEDADIEQTVLSYVSVVRDVFGQIASIGSIGLNTTGGLDTRTILGALLDRGSSPLLMYGIGNSGLTNTKSADLQTACMLSESQGLPLYLMDWSGNQPYSPESLSELFAKYGFLFTTYGASAGLLHELEGGITPYPLLQLGGYSPALTNMKPWEKESARYSFADLIEHFTPLANHLVSRHKSEYLSYVEASVRQALERSPVRFSDTDSTLDEFVKARLFLYLRPESKNTNFFNEFSYYLAPFISKRLYDPLLTLPLKYRRSDAFQIRLAYSLAPQLFEVPIFSGMQSQTLDLKTLTMKRANSGGKPASMRRLLPSSIKRAILHLVSQSGVAAELTGVSADKVKDFEISSAVRNDSLKHINSHSLTAGTFTKLVRVNLPIVHNLRMLLFAADEIERLSTG